MVEVEGVIQDFKDEVSLFRSKRLWWLAYKNNDIVFYINGVQIGVDTSATIPTCSRVDIGQNYAGASQLGDGILNANIFKTRLLNTELAQLTTL